MHKETVHVQHMLYVKCDHLHVWPPEDADIAVIGRPNLVTRRPFRLLITVFENFLLLLCFMNHQVLQNLRCKQLIHIDPDGKKIGTISQFPVVWH